MTKPIKEGSKCVMKDGRVLYVHMVHRPGNGWGVSASPEQDRSKWLSKSLRSNDNDYYPWHKFKKLLVKVQEP